jgi:hypothetical protein
MKSSDTLKLWESVEKTDPKHTKKAKIGQMNITAIAPQYQRKNATEVFGPFGLGWGVNDERWSFLDFKNGTKLATYQANLWYKLDGKEAEFPITSNVKVCYVTKNGQGYLMIDDEYAKKAQTDAITKGLSALGFNADVFMGLFDDNKYVNQMKEEFAPEPPKPADVIQKAATFEAMSKLTAYWKTLTKELQEREDVKSAFSAKKAELTSE